MNWQDKGYLISLNKYNENSSVAEFYTENHGKCSGIIFGSSSKKLKSYLILGNKLHINFSAKSINSIGNFKLEIDKVNTAYYLDNEIKLQAIIYILQIIRILTVENQSNNKIFNQIDNFFIILKEDMWIKDFIFWELSLFKILGYEINFNDHVKKEFLDGEERYVSIYDKKKIIPNFLIDINNHIKLDKQDLINSINLVGDFLSKSILQDANISVPKSRNRFVELLNKL